MGGTRSVCLALFLVLGLVALAEAQTNTRLFISADMVRGPAGSGPVCVLSSRFMRNERVAWRIRVQDVTGKELDDKGLKSLVVELTDGQKFPAQFGGHPPKEPTAYLWSAGWTIPDDYPTGTLNYKVVATALDGTTQTWEPVNNKYSLLTVVAGTFEPAK
jgi:hypothetical protein